ncbi:hypothetical protein F2P81_010916 [Scophthalmus maximus]|uniref:Uncharacterized protein n=1 Tax=Scophthalmus maximus TaxID=52904 RepID=A0A6A4T766_SCOMX|nr:hypothetical protein F2P81_010916 [Scophthalmus maximus]
MSGASDYAVKPNQLPVFGLMDAIIFMDLKQMGLCLFVASPLFDQATNLRPDLVLWSSSCQRCLPHRADCEMLRYADLVAEAAERGWKAEVAPSEVGCRGFVVSSTTRLLREVGIRGDFLDCDDRTLVRSITIHDCQSTNDHFHCATHLDLQQKKHVDSQQ